MNEIKIGILMMIIGILLLVISEKLYEPKEVDPKNIDVDLYGEQIKVEGKVSKIEIGNKISFIHFSGANSIDFVYFDKIEEISREDKIRVTGRVEKYQGNIQVVVDKIYKIDERHIND